MALTCEFSELHGCNCEHWAANPALRSHRFAPQGCTVNNDLKRQHQRPEGKLIEAAAKRSKKSLRQIAREIEMSEGRVRQIVNGYKTEGGSVIQIVGPPNTVATIATAAGVKPDQMRAAGLADVADAMSGMWNVSVGEGEVFYLATHRQAREDLAAWLDRYEEDGGVTPPPTPALMMWDFEQLLEAVAAKHRDELRLKDYFIEMLGADETSSPFGHKGGDGNAEDPAGRRSAPIGAEVSDAPGRDDVALAADEQGEIAGEQESHNET